MANLLNKKSAEGRLTFILALSAFLISGYLVYPKLIQYFDFNQWAASDWLLFLQLLVFILSAYIAYTTISSSRATARERATLDTILDDNKDLELAISKSIVLNFDENPEKFLKIKIDKFKEDFEREPCTTLSELCEQEASKLEECETNVRNHLIQVLNRFEFYAVGINSGLLDEELFKRTHCSNAIRIWNAASPAVTHIRKQSQKPTFFKDLEILAKRWENNPLSEKSLR